MELKMKNSFLSGNLIYLRPLELTDVNDEYISWMNDASLSGFIPAMTFPSRQQSVENYVKSNINNPDVIFFAIVEKTSGRHVGNIKLGPINWIDRNAEFGRLIGRTGDRAKGYGYEAASLVVGYALNVLNLHKLFASSLASNSAAILSNKKLGFEVEATIKEKRFTDGKYEDIVIMGLSKTSFHSYLKKNCS